MKGNLSSAPSTNTIDAVLSKTVEDVIKRLDLEGDKRAGLRTSLSHLTQIQVVYPASQEQLLQSTLSKIETVSLLQFQVERLISLLLEDYFKLIPLFKESYQIAVLNSNDPKYQRLVVDEPFIQFTIPLPFECPPLAEAKCIGGAKCLTLGEELESEE